MPRLPELRLDQRLQLMLGDANVLDRTSRPVKHSHVTSEVPEVARDEARPISLSLAETVELLVRRGSLSSRCRASASSRTAELEFN